MIMAASPRSGDMSATASGFLTRFRLVVAVFLAFTLVAVMEASHAYVGYRHGYVSTRVLTAKGNPLGWFDLAERGANAEGRPVIYECPELRFQATEQPT
jgi:hypothetical protein